MRPAASVIMGNSSCCSRMTGDIADRNSTASISWRALRRAFSMRSRVIGSRAVSGARRGRAARDATGAGAAAAAADPRRSGATAGRERAAARSRSGQVARRRKRRTRSRPRSGPIPEPPPSRRPDRSRTCRCRSPERGSPRPRRAGRTRRGSTGASRRARCSVPIRMVSPCPLSRYRGPPVPSRDRPLPPARPPSEPRPNQVPWLMG